MAHVIDSRTAFPTQAARQLEIIANQEAAKKFFMPTQSTNLNPKGHPNVVINPHNKPDPKATARTENSKCFGKKGKK